MRVSSAHNSSIPAKKLPNQELDSTRASLRLWIVGILLVMTIGGTIASHFVLPAATCFAHWAKLNCPVWALLVFLLGDSPFLAAKKLFSGHGLRVALQVLTRIAQENNTTKS